MMKFSIKSNKQKMKVKTIIKGLLLWVTGFAIMLFLSGVDSIVDQGNLIPWLIVCAVLVCLCYKFISEKELEILSGYRWLNKWLS